MEMPEEHNMSASSSRDENEKHQLVLKNVYELLECPVCTTSMSPPIRQCPNGHILCSMCTIKVRSLCPICRMHMGSIRCLALEKLTEPLKVSYECPYDCPYAHSQCSLTGNIPELVTHLRDDHNVSVYDRFKFSHCYIRSHSQEMENVKGMSSVFNCYNRQFCFHFEAFLLGMDTCYMAFIRFMGEETEAKKFGYSLEMGGNVRKLTWQGVPRSIRDSHQKVCDGLDGLVIPQNLAFFFSEGNEQVFKLRVHGHIWIAN